MEQNFSNVKNSLSQSINSISQNTGQTFDSIRQSGMSGLYVNIVFFFILSIIAVNDLKSDPDNENNPYKRPEKETAKTVISCLSVVLVVIYIFSYVTRFSAPSWSNYYYMFLLLMFFTYAYITLSYNRLFNYAMGITFVLTILVGFAIFFNAFSNYLKSIKGVNGFFIYLIFYIPCLISDFAEYIIKEFKLTTNAVFILFIVELILLLLYFYLPSLINQISITGGEPILERYVYLSSENIIPVQDIVTFENKQTNVADFGEKSISTNYALSMWVYLNNYSTSMAAYNKESLIFDYGNGKPKITYYNNEDDITKMDTYRIYFSNKLNSDNNNSNFYEIQIPNQKWNNFVFNYSSKYVDLFINGKLTRTFYFKENIPDYHVGDVVTTGSENGLSGAIANIRYYQKKLTSREITAFYNIFKKKNPPTNNL